MAKNPKLSQELIDNIENYAKEIITLEDFVKVVRQNPGYHLGAKGNKGLKNMAREIWQNSFDELDKPSSPCNHVDISFDERNYAFFCRDNGRGIPFGELYRVFTDPNTSSNYEKRPYEYSSGLHGVGSKVVCAMSHKFKVVSYKYTGEGRMIELTEGVPDYPNEKKVSNPTKFQGTEVTFIPSVDALGDISIKWRDVYTWLMNIFPLCSIGASVTFTAIDAKGKEHREEIINEDGIMSYLIRATEKPLIAPISMFKDTGYMKLEVVVTWDADESANSTIIAFSNKCPTTMGTHIDGFDAGITQFFSSYMNKIYLASQKKSKTNIIAADIRSGIKAVVSVAHLTPIFDGQSKEKLSNADMEPFMRDSVKALLEEWTKNNPKDVARLCKYFKDVADIRASADKQRIRLTDKYDKSGLTGLPSKYVAPTGNKNCELFICEGDSAAGLIKNHRLNAIQGYFPIRGKIPNAFAHSRDKFLSNPEVAGIIRIINAGYGKNFDISKCKWDKIIFCTDADRDGNHIRALLLRFFIMYMPDLIRAGKVYSTMPPLYGIQSGKNSYIYLRDRMEYVKYIQRLFCKDNVITLPNSKVPLTPQALSKIFYTNIDYTVEVNKIADLYAIDPVFLESILTLVYNVTPKDKFKAALKKQYRFIHSIDFSKNMIHIEALVNSKSNTVFINPAFLNDCKNILEIIKNNEQMVYKLNGRVVSIYELMTEFENSAPSRITRFKGLGEMSGSCLFDSTLDPSKRSLIQYTIENVTEEIESIKYYEANMRALIEDVKVTRFDVMD